MGEMYDCWLGYQPVEGAAFPAALSRVAATGTSPVLRTGLDELVRRLSSLTGSMPAVVPATESGPHVLLAAPGSVPVDLDGADEAMLISARVRPGTVVITGSTQSACLHAVFEFLRRVQAGEDVTGLHVTDGTSNKLRMISHWDNIDGSIERGYAGRSIFFAGGEVVADLSRVRDYARLLASTGVNAVAINNVNVTREAARLITGRHLPDVARIARVFRDYGIRLFLSVSFDSPIVLGGVRTADPLDPLVAQWWRRQVAEIYTCIPDFGGFLVKADSESRPGPSIYDRTQAEGANVLAEALRPYGGVVIWRAFVYDCYQDWRDRSTDRARACYDTFKPLDGEFAENAIVQVKLGPMDFQVREPDSPLLTAFRRTSQAIEVQITQEYTGQQKDLCFLHPQWHEVMSEPATVDGRDTTLAHVVSGHATGRPYGGVTGVANVGDDPSWTGHVLAQANLYAFGRLAWNPSLSPRTVAEEWVAQTFGACDVITGMLLASWGIYESYTAPLGVGWMVAPHYHYGPDIDGYEYSRWGTYHFADRDGIGVDRTQATGTGYTGQYPADRAAVYDDVKTCPDNLLLFFHHVPYTHVLHSGKTVIQHIYDSHFDGAEGARRLRDAWLSLEGQIDPVRFEQVRGRFELQVANAEAWRDIVNTYFFRKSGIADEKGRTIY